MDNVELKTEISILKATIQELTTRITKLEEGSIGTGVYLDGCPEYARDFIENKEEKKDGDR